MFFDQKSPSIGSTIAERELTSDRARVHVVETDDSLKLKLYQDDSLIDSVDHTSLYSLKGGVKIEKDIIIPLKYGDNEVKLSAIDLSNYRSNEILHIYRNHFYVRALELKAEQGSIVTAEQLSKQVVVSEAAGSYHVTVDETPKTTKAGEMGFAKVSIHYADGSIDKVAIPVRFVDFEAERKAEAERQAQLEHQAELDRKAELEHESDLERKFDSEREAELERQSELNRRAELERQAQLKRQYESARKADLEHEADLKRKFDLEREAELKRQSELNRRAELEHRAQLSRKVKTERSSESSYKSNSESKVNSVHRSTQTSTPAPIFKPQTSLPMSDNIKEIKQTTNSQPQVTSITKSSVLPSTGDKTETHYVVGALLALSSLLFGFAGKLKLRKISKSLKEK